MTSVHFSVLFSFFWGNVTLNDELKLLSLVEKENLAKVAPRRFGVTLTKDT